MPKFDYDLFVIGTGEAGSTAAHICSAAGWKVAIADDNPFGGTCSLRGCNPKRTLAGIAELIYRHKGMTGKGISGALQIDWGESIYFKDEMTKGISAMHEESFSRSGIDMHHGFATFSGINEVFINNKKISSAKILIASGSKPRTLGIPGENYLITSDQLLMTKDLPSRILFIGAGYISMEFSHVLAAAGKKVTLLEYAPSPLMAFDRDLVSMLVNESLDKGIDIKVNQKVTNIESDGRRFLIYTSGEKEELFESDMVVNGAGRIPNVDQLMLENADINHNRYHIKVNDYLQSVSNKNIYVAGDAHAEGIQLTPVAEMEGKIVAHNLLYGNFKTPDYKAIPSVVFTHPQLAMTGAPADPSSNMEIIFQDTSRKHITRRLGMSSSAFKLVVDKETNRIRGMHMLGFNVDEVINQFAEAIRNGKTTDDLKEIPWTFPSVTYDIIHRI
ncbi:MAG TPA: NAD(P)/FAD-dependent oxidoreductase [Chitinispirillaceae bacterium]|nr:NAD(P)/FAD-dependent oxidoreductase [Chitinispirillaceae bacterium]